MSFVVPSRRKLLGATAAVILLAAIIIGSRVSNHVARLHYSQTRASKRTIRAVTRFRKTRTFLDGYPESVFLRWGGPFRGTVHTVLHYLLRHPFAETPFRIKFQRELLVLADKGTVGLDWAYPQLVSASISGHHSVRRPTVLLHHGLCGDSEAFYVRHLVPKLLDRGYHVVSLVARGCGGLKLSTPEGFTAARTQDMRETVAYLKTLDCTGDLYCVGFSLGACILLKYLGEENSESDIVGAVAVSPNFDFSMLPPYFELWSRYRLVQGLKNWLLRHKDTLGDKVNWDLVMNAQNVREFDTHAIVKQHNFQDVDHYYSESSAKHVQHQIHVPTLSLTALDDPVCSAESVPKAEEMGEGLVSLQTDYGGHVAFGKGWLGGDSWEDDVILDWLESCRAARDVNDM